VSRFTNNNAQNHNINSGIIKTNRTIDEVSSRAIFAAPNEFTSLAGDSEMMDIPKNINNISSNAFKNEVVGSVLSFLILETCQSMIVLAKRAT
jgi:hypothetical protein